MFAPRRIIFVSFPAVGTTKEIFDNIVCGHFGHTAALLLLPYMLNLLLVSPVVVQLFSSLNI